MHETEGYGRILDGRNMAFKMLTCTTYLHGIDRHAWASSPWPGIDHEERNRTIEILLGKY